MPYLDITNPAVIRFLLESYEKEQNLRVKWANKHEEKFRKAATYTKDVKDYTQADIAKCAMVAGIATITRDHKEAARYRTRAPVKDYMLHKPVEMHEPISVMMPVRAEVKDLLRTSRKDYLKKRNGVQPGDKYNFIEAGNWVYGWKLEDSEIKLRGPAHGTIAHLQHARQSRVGPQPDPLHYKSADAAHNFCSQFEA